MEKLLFISNLKSVTTLLTHPHFCLRMSRNFDMDSTNIRPSSPGNLHLHGSDARIIKQTECAINYSDQFCKLEN